MADFLTEQVNALEKRLKELKPAHDEYLELERVHAALTGATGRRAPGRPRGSSTARGSSTRRGPGRPKGSTTRRASGNGRRRRRRRSGGTRGDQALKIVRDNPGITVSEMASRMSIKQPNYLYRVMNQLQTDGAVKKTGKGYTAS